MLRRLLPLFLLASCGLDNEVGQDGRYRASPGAPITDSALYPLERMLVLEHDAASERALVYYFTGALSQAELGIPDLRRIAAGHGRFQMAFDTPLTNYLDAALAGHGRTIDLRTGPTTSLALTALEDPDLGPTGASRMLASTENPDLPIATYFGVLEAAGELPRLELLVNGPNWTIEPALGALELSIEATDDGFALDYGDASRADYVIVELAQRIEETAEDGRVLDALVRTTLAPGAPYEVTTALLTDVAEKGCFSNRGALHLRVTQVARVYERASEGDSAVVQQRRDTLVLAPELWTAWLDDPEPAEYCSEYE
jgi:hypothetical protein